MNAAAPAGFNRLFSDQRLTRRAVGGDQRAFAAIFRRHHQSLYRFCLALLGNPDDAQEALQNTMAKVLRALPGEEREIELKPWLYRIARNESIDLLRRRQETRELDVEQVAPGYGLAEDVATRERLRQLLDDLRQLPERQREVLVMRELSGLAFEQIGSALGTSSAVARQTLYEARQSLRQMEEGREMSCEVVARALSDGDGRVIRRRDVRAHLRSCLACQRFREEIESRQHELAALSPLPAVAAVGMLKGLLGGSQGAAGSGLAATLGGGAAKSIGASAAVKGAATVAVVATIGVTAADKSGVIHLGLPGERSSRSSDPAPAGADSGAGGVKAHGPGKMTGAASANRQESIGEDPSAGTQAHLRKSGSQADSAGGKDAAELPIGTSPAHSVGQGKGNGQGHGNDSSTASTGAAEHPHGRGHEKQHPAAAAHGQETAAANGSRHDAVPGSKGKDKGDGKGGGAPEGKGGGAPGSKPQGSSAQAPADPSAASPETSAQDPAAGGESGPPGKAKGHQKDP